MAISDDTAALVAAQLTAAWAAKTGTWTPQPHITLEEAIAKTYITFRDAVREVDIKPAHSTAKLVE
ncbi:hypothetical protein [Sphingobium sp. YR768]|uniref:hypothetical protein n=1 Tax=Sphingobium sp. YR768 TaxID=1884365 RepID=UPI0008C0BFA2|nr:hypothetical protein [Sphingobium sp. YR768]SES08132.1 hypothetical protein SAMN05518866_13717 [Sphingobium sp. YR768]